MERYNHYFGWYGGKMEDNGPWMDNFHKVHPESLRSECPSTDVEGIITYHGPNPACKDYSEEYRRFTMSTWRKCWTSVRGSGPPMYGTCLTLAVLPETRAELQDATTKGLVTMDRKDKERQPLYLQAYWNKAPMVHLCGRRYAQRAGETTEIRRIFQPADGYTVFKRRKAEEKSAEKVFVFTVALAEGQNIVVAEAGGVKTALHWKK